ncbi:MAG TPA: YDG domain-containing protein, partial [Sphaerochaeta sp.]|nr:YDG domain-containing protein [Sphaerochaeta sp.]
KGSLSGIVGEDDVTLDVLARYSWSGDYQVGEGKSIDIFYTLGGSDGGNYTAPADGLVSGRIALKQLTVVGSAVGKTKQYDGNTSVSIIDDGNLVGVATYDDVRVRASASYDSKSAASGKTITITYTLLGTAIHNYMAPVAEEVTGNITKRLLQSLDNAIPISFKNYDGTTVANFPEGITSSWFVEGDNISIVPTASYNDKYVGSGKTITYSYALDGSDAGNYEIPEGGTWSGLIEKRRLNASLVADSKVYDGTTSVVMHYLLPDKIEGDDVYLFPIYPCQFFDANVGVDKPIDVFSYEMRGSDMGNYFLDGYYVPPKASITRKVLSVTATANSKSYDGNASTTGSLALGNKVASDVLSATGSFAFSNINAGNNKTVTVTGITLTGTNKNNYTVPTTTTTTANITKAVMTGSVSITGVLSVGQVLTADLTDLTNSGTPTYQWKRGGTPISGAKNKNYTLVSADSNYEITVTVTADGTNYTGSVTSEPIILRLEQAYYLSESSTFAGNNAINLIGGVPNKMYITFYSISGEFREYDEKHPELPQDIHCIWEMTDERGRGNLKIIQGRTSQSKLKIRLQEQGDDQLRLIPLEERDLSVGDYYAGGIVGYLSSSGDPIAMGKGLIVAETDQGDSVWHTTQTVSVGVEKDENLLKGAGFSNTNTIIDTIGSNNAAGIARRFKEWDNYNGGGFRYAEDWFLPSLEELKALHANESKIGGFIPGYGYWSSSESSSSLYSSDKCAMGTHMGTGGAVNAFYKDVTRKVRAVRYF